MRKATIKFNESPDLAFKVCTDTIALSNFIEPFKKTDLSILEIGCSSGYISLFLAEHFPVNITAIDINPIAIKNAKENLKANKDELKGSVDFHNICISQLPKKFKTNSFDIIITNPPYRKNGSGKVSADKDKLKSTFEEEISFGMWIDTIRRMLKPKGTLYLSFLPERLCECLEILRENKLEPKIIRFVHSVDKSASSVLIKAVKGVNPGVEIKPPFVF